MPKTSDELARDRTEARASVPATFVQLSTAPDTMAARLARFFALVDSARSMNDTTALHESTSCQFRSRTARPGVPVGPRTGCSTWCGGLRFGLRERSYPEEWRTTRNYRLFPPTTSRLRQVGGGNEPAGGEVSERSIPTSDVFASRTFFERAVGLLPAAASPDVQEILRLILIQYIEFSYRLDEQATELDQGRRRPVGIHR